MFISSKTSSKFFGAFANVDGLSTIDIYGTGGRTLELMPGDICLMDSTSKEYNGNICLAKSPTDSKAYFQRIYLDGDTAIICDATDGEETGRFPLSDVQIDAIVTGIIRKFAPLPAPLDLSKYKAEFDKMEETADTGLVNYYSPDNGLIDAIRKKYKGSSYMCVLSGFYYGFEAGRRAEKNAKRRERRRKN